MLSSVTRSLGWLAVGLAAVAACAATVSFRHVAANAAPSLPEPAKDDNPRVQPGLVKWHATTADAQAAAEKSGRPVLVFHMMGQLDRQFC
jgi:hypothetical protein